MIQSWTDAIEDLRSLCRLLLLSGPSAASDRAAARLNALCHTPNAVTRAGTNAGTEAFAPQLDLHLNRLEASIAFGQSTGMHEVRDAAA